MKLSKELEDAVELLRNAELDARNGMTEELFWMISALVPIPNVDLLVMNERGQLLLSRRNDDFFEKSWHIPGGCLRYGEELTVRVQETAKRELGCEVEFDVEPLAVRNVLRGDNNLQTHPKERGHNSLRFFTVAICQMGIVSTTEIRQVTRTGIYSGSMNCHMIL